MLDRTIARGLVADVNLTLLYTAGFATNLFLAFRGGFDDGVPGAILRALAVTIMLAGLLYLYRLFLFFTVFHSV